MGVSAYFANRILDRILGLGTAIPVATQYVGLSTTTPNFDGSNFTEPVGGGYARQSVTASSFWSSISGVVTSLSAVDFLASGASWGTVTHVGVFDALSGGNLLWFLALEASENIQDGDDSHFLTGNLQLEFQSVPFSDSVVSDVMDDVANDGSPYTPSVGLQVALSTTTPNANGTNITEPVGNGYNRASVTNNATNFPAAVAGVKTHAIDFPFPEATGSWGTVSHWVIFEGGVMVCYGALTTPTAIVSGDRATFRPGEIEIALT